MVYKKNTAQLLNDEHNEESFSSSPFSKCFLLCAVVSAKIS